MSVRLAVSPRVTARLPLDGFSEILETVIYVCRETLKFGYNRTKISGTFREDLKHRLLLLALKHRLFIVVGGVKSPYKRGIRVKWYQAVRIAEEV